MTRYKLCLPIPVALMLSLFCAAPLKGQGRLPATSPTDVPVTHSNEFEADVQELIESDRTTPPPRNGILFIGGNIFVQWTQLAVQMSPLPVFNRSFGGAHTWEAVHYIGSLVLPHDPSVIVYYCGSNDINLGESPGAIAGRFQEFCRRVHKILPDTKILFVSIIRAPQKMSHWGDVDQTNTQVKEYCLSERNTDYIDVNHLFFKRLGQPNMEMFADDEVNLVPKSYDALAGALRPTIEREYKSVKRPAAPREKAPRDRAKSQ